MEAMTKNMPGDCYFEEEEAKDKAYLTILHAKASKRLANKSSSMDRTNEKKTRFTNRL